MQAGKLISLIAVGAAAIVAAGSHGIVAASFTVPSAGQKVTIDEASGTTYQKGTGSALASAIATAKPVPALGTTESAFPPADRAAGVSDALQDSRRSVMVLP